MSKRQCKGTNKAGEPCGAAPLKDSKWCRAHDPLSPAEARFGTSEQAAEAGALGGAAGRRPRVLEIMRERAEAEAEAILEPYFEAITGAVLYAFDKGELNLTSAPDLGARIAAAEKLLDRIDGKPKQATELSGPEGGPIHHEGTGAIDPSKLSREQRAALREILDAQGG